MGQVERFEHGKIGIRNLVMRNLFWLVGSGKGKCVH